MLIGFSVHTIMIFLLIFGCGWNKKYDEGDGRDRFGFPVTLKAKVCHFLLYTLVLSIISLIALGI